MTLFYQSFTSAIGVAGGNNQPVFPSYAIAANGLGLCWSTDAFITFTLWKPYSSTAASVVTGPHAQWSQLGSSTSGTVASAVSTGSVRMTSWSGQITSNQTDVANLDTGVTTATVGLSKMLFFRATNAAGQHNTISQTRVGLADTDETGTAVSATGTAATDQIRTGDWVAICVGIKDDAPTHTSQSLTIAGCTLGTLTWFAKESTTSGADLAMYTGVAQVTAGSSTGTVTYAATSSVSGAAATAAELVVLREDPQPFIKTDDPGGWAISWANPAGVSVDLQRSASITSPSWSTIYTGTGATYTDTAKSAGQKFFYRIVMDGTNSAVTEAVQLPFTEDFSTTGATGRPWLNWKAEGQMAFGDATDPASVADSRVTINSGIGRLAGDGVTAATGSRAYAGVRQTMADHAVTARYRFQNATSVSALRVSLRADTYSSPAGVLPMLGYTLRIDPTTAQVGMYDFELVGNATVNQLTVLSETRGSGAVATLVANSWYRFRFEVFGTGTPTVRYRIWADGASEPTTWATADASTAPRIPAEGTLLIGAGFNAETTAFLDIDEIGYYNPNAPTTASASDTAAAAEALSLAVQLGADDTAVAAESLSLAAQVSASDTVATADSGSASGSSPVLGLWSAPVVATTTSASTSKSGTDTGSGTDSASVARASSATDTASGADTASVTRSSTATDVAAAADVASVSVTTAAADTATAADSATVSRSSTAADAASSSDAATLAITSTATDIGTATDTAAVTSQTKTGSDTASSTDTASAPVVAVSAADTAAAVDDAIRVVFVTGSDAATSTDAASSTAQLAADEPVTAADTAAVGVTQTVTGSDTAAGADSAAVISATSTATDTAAAAEAATLAQASTATDTATAADTVTTSATLVATPDTAAGADTASAGRTSTAADSASAGDSAALYTSAATYSDDFTRGVDQANQVGGNWAQAGASGMGTSSGRVVAGTGAGIARYTSAVPAPGGLQVSQLVYVGGSFIGPTVAMQAFANGSSFVNAGDFYIFRQQGSGAGIHIARRDAVGAVYNTLVSSTRNVVAGDIMRLEYDGTTLNAYLNSALVLTTNPATPITGQSYVGFAHGSTSQFGTLLIDDWTGGLPLAAVTLTSADTATAVDDTSLAAGQNVSGTDSASAADSASTTVSGTATDTATSSDTAAASATPAVADTASSADASSLAATVLVNQTFTDDFNRADAATLGANWVSSLSPTPGIRSNAIRGSTSGNAVLRWATPAPPGGTQFSQLTLLDTTRTPTLSVAMNGFATGAALTSNYTLQIGSGLLRIGRRVGVSTGNIGTEVSYTPTVGDVLRLEYDGAQVRGYVNGVLMVTATDSTHTNSYVGFSIIGGTGNELTYSAADDWSGGAIGGRLDDSAATADTAALTVAVSAADTAAAVDAAARVSVTGADSATAADSAALVAAPAVADAATAADAASSPRITTGDTATAADVATVTVTLAGSDTANGLDMADLFGSGGGGVTLNISESASSADSASVTRSSTASDTASSADTATVSSVVAASDAATAADGIASDAWDDNETWDDQKPWDSQGLTASLAGTDTATAADSASVFVLVAATDLATAADTAAVTVLTTLISAADSAAAADTASAYELLGQLWPRPRSRAPALVGQLWPRR